MNRSQKYGKLLLNSLLAIGFFVIELLTVNAEEPAAETKEPIVFDVMHFQGKPDLGLSQELSFIYEWEATLRDEGVHLKSAGSKEKPSSRTIEHDDFSKAIDSRAGYEYIVIDIESLADSEDPIAINYVELAKRAAPESKIAWWNTGPRNVTNKTFSNPLKHKEWQAIFTRRQSLVEANDFCILGSYFKFYDMSIDTWKARHLPRIAEARRLYGDKPLFVTLAPHSFGKGKPWPFVSGDMLGQAMDTLAELKVDGIVLWSFEGTGQLQHWNENHEWVRAVRDRTGPGGRYKKPADSK